MDEHEIGRLLRLLPAAPAEWTQAAQELPFLSAELADIMERARGDGGFRDGLRTDAGATLKQHGYDLSPSVVAHLMRILPDEG
ncbi:MAG TPA: hypothetical protein VIM27_13290 [Gaiellales bacterium]